ncbi:hypothetical protein DFJ73DRAFT_140341 [Zopfochytrium polystomum]|nr:hypothetical protein DFJ73DRAFT_140341 [Zopfochytrium polystomum]
MEDQAATTTTTTVATASAAAPTAPRPAMTTAAAAPAATANGHAASSPGPARISPASAVDALRQGGGGGSASCPASPSPSAFVSALPTRQSSAPPTPAKPGAVTPRKLRCPEPQHSSGASSTSSTPGSPLSPNRHSRVESAPVRLPSSSGPVAHPKRWSSSPRTQPFTPTPASPKWTKSAYWRKFPRMPLVRVAKKLLAQLETLWSEVTGQDVDGAAFSPGPPLPTSPSSSSIAPKSNTPTAFFLHSIPPDFRPLNPSGLEDGPALNDEALRL